MDPNISTEMKGYVAPAIPATGHEDVEKPPVQPVPASSEGDTVKLNDRALHGQRTKEEQKKQGELAREDMDEAIKEAVEEIDQRLESIGSSFRFGLFQHMESKSIVGQLRDKETDEIIKQFPSDEVLKLRAKLQDLVGLLFDEKV